MVYGEWLIRMKVDQSEAYNRLIAKEGLPLFHEGWSTRVLVLRFHHIIE